MIILTIRQLRKSLKSLRDFIFSQTKYHQTELVLANVLNRFVVGILSLSLGNVFTNVVALPQILSIGNHIHSIRLLCQVSSKDKKRTTSYN